ncbi:MAG: hypothetical protein OYH77_05340 [Pseudomonadota bacterium]|nr:hypothetical protein [Pseudomonadota bacterium]
MQLKKKIVAWVMSEPFRKLSLVIILVGATALWMGWREFFAETKAFMQYKQEQAEKANCFPSWKGDNRKGV